MTLRSGINAAQNRRNRDRADLVVDGAGKTDIATGIGFLDHMLTLFASHGLFDLTVRATATCTSTSTTPRRMSSSAWARRSTRRWATGAGWCAPHTATPDG